MRKILVDVPSLLHYYCGLNGGDFSSAICSALSLVLSFHKKNPDCSLSFFWDRGLRWRNVLVDSYKSSPFWGDYESHFDALYAIFSGVGASQVFMPNVEAKDAIASYIQDVRLEAPRGAFYIFSADISLCQLLDSRVTVMVPEGSKIKYIDAYKLVDDVGGSLESFRLYLTLAGVPSLGLVHGIRLSTTEAKDVCENFLTLADYLLGLEELETLTPSQKEVQSGAQSLADIYGSLALLKNYDVEPIQYVHSYSRLSLSPVEFVDSTQLPEILKAFAGIFSGDTPNMKIG